MEIREITPDDIPAIKSLYKNNLFFIDYFIFSGVFNSTVKSKNQGKGTCIIAIDQNSILGSFCVSWFLIKNEKHGLIDCVVTQKDMYGKGIAKSLLVRSIQWLKDQGCSHIYATVERYNSRSWNMFMHNGFSVYEFPQQLKDLGLRTFKLWAKEGYFFGIGNYFVKLNESEKITDSKPKNSAYHKLIGWFGIFLPLSILILIQSKDFMLLPYIGIISFISILIHETSHWLIAKTLNVQTCFRVNEPGILFWALISLIGGIYPFYGSTYVKQLDWSYIGDKRKSGLNKNGPIYLIGPILSAILSMICKTMIGLTTGYWQNMFQIGRTLNIYLALFNLIPIKSAGGFPWDGMKIFKWNKWVWAIETVLIAVIIFIL